MCVCVKGKGSKGNKMEGPETDEAKPHYSGPTVALKAADTFRRAPGLLTRSNAIICQVFANNFGASLLLRPLRTALFPGSGNIRKPPFDGATGDTPRAHWALTKERHT